MSAKVVRRRIGGRRAVPASALVWLVGLGAPLAAQPVPLGPAFQVNSLTLGSQEYPDLARAADGSFVVVWMSEAADVWEFDVHGRRYAADGTPLGRVFLLHGDTLGDQRFPAIAALPDGGFVVAWESSTSGYFGTDIVHRRFDADGAPAGRPEQVNGYTTGRQADADVVSDGGGGYVVTWTGPGAGEEQAVIARAYDELGVPRGDEFRVSRVGGDAHDAVVARTGAGELVAAYSDDPESQPPGHPAILGQRFTREGELLGPEFQVSSGAGYHGEGWTAISAAPDGDFVVAWIQWDFHHNAPHARRYSRAAAPLADEFAVATVGDSIEVGHDAQGAILLTWDDYTSTGLTQAFTVEGLPLGGPFEAVELGSNGRNARVSFDAESNPVFVWQRFVGEDAGDEIDARLFRGASLLVDGFESGDFGRWSSSWPRGAARGHDPPAPSALP